jgi:hypothetical protein
MAFVISGSAKTGPNIKDVGNLAFYVDASNPKSYDSVNYPDKLFSMVPGGKDAQLYGYPYYTPQDNGGSITFSTASQQRFLIDPVPLTTQSFAVEVWFRAGKVPNGLNDINRWMGIIAAGDPVSSAGATTTGWAIGTVGGSTRLFYGVSVSSSAGYNSITQYDDIPPNPSYFTPPLYTVGQVYNFLLQRNTIDQKMELYVNGNKVGNFTLSNSASLVNPSPPTIKTQTWVYGCQYNNNTYYSMKMYTNTQFTAAEVQQNFNAVRTKFGI